MTFTNNEKLYLIIAAIGLIAFFLPWVDAGWLGSYTGYELYSLGSKLNISNKAPIMLLSPIAFLFIIILRCKLIKGVSPKLVKVFEFVPLLVLVLIINKLLTKLRIDFEDLMDITDVFEIFHIGFVVVLAASILIIFAPLIKPYKQ